MISPAANSIARMNYYEKITTEIFREHWILEIYLKNKVMYKIIKSSVFCEYLMVRGLWKLCYKENYLVCTLHKTI